MLKMQLVKLRKAENINQMKDTRKDIKSVLVQRKPDLKKVKPHYKKENLEKKHLVINMECIEQNFIENGYL